MRLTPIITVLVASAVALLPIYYNAPLLPPLGYMMLLSWRLLRSDIWPVWIGAPLGLFDDLATGEPIGSAVALWTLTLVIIDLLDRRVVWRDMWLDWVIASGFLAVYLPVAGLLARTGNLAEIGRLIWPQLMFSVLLMPMVMRVAARLDDWRRRL
jgi:rod shape-determining protein MreD